MSHLTVRRSLPRQLLLLAAGVLLVLAAIDVVWAHRIAGHPETSEETGEITTRGRSQQRTDYLWGTMFLLVGGGLVLFSTASLVARRPVAEVTDDALRLRIGHRRRMVDIPWSNVTWLHTGTDGEDEAVPPRVLLVHVVDASAYPAAPWSAAWDGSTLMVETDGWSVRPEEVVAHGRLARETWLRSTESGDATFEGDEP